MSSALFLQGIFMTLLVDFLFSMLILIYIIEWSEISMSNFSISHLCYSFFFAKNTLGLGFY